MDIPSNGHVKVEPSDISHEEIEPLTTEPASRALSDGSHNDTPTPTYKHKWTVEQRLTLTMLAESYSNKWNEMTAVFNHFHKSDLRRCGGLRKEVVNAQWNDMRAKNFDAAAALSKLQATLSPYDRLKLISRAELKKKADEVGVKLKAKGPTNSNPSSLSRKRKRADFNEDRRTDFLPDRSDIEHDLPIFPKTPVKTNARKLDNGLLTPPDTRGPKRQCLTAEKKMAQIGFRAFTAQSQGTYCPVLGIRAGAFLNCPTVPLARDLDVSTYRREALHHVTKHDHSRPSKFVSATKNPMRAIHMALRGGQNSAIAVIDLRKADENGNVEKAYHLDLRTEFRYSAAGEYLIFGGVDKKAIISHIPLSRLLANIPTTSDGDDPFLFKVLQANERLSHARGVIQKEIPPMTYSLGQAVGALVYALGIRAKHFESGVWSLVQDYKWYNAEKSRKRGHWSTNAAFKNGALQGYTGIQSSTLASLEIENNIKAAREIIEIEDESESDQDTGSDSDFSDEDNPTPVGVETEGQNARASQASLQFFDVQTNKWTTSEEPLSDAFFAELRDIAGMDSNDSKIESDTFVESVLDVSRSEKEDRDMTGDKGFGGPDMDIDSVMEDPVAVPARDHQEEFGNLDELCADIMHMHGDKTISAVQAGHNMDIGYEFSWTGM